MANTFIQLNDTPSSYSGNVQYLITAGNQIDFVTLSTNELIDVNTLGAYKPVNGQVLQWFGGANEFRPANNDPYSAGNGLNKTGGTLNVSALNGGGLGANASGIFIEPISNVAGTYGNATHIPNIVVNDKGQITSVTLADGSFGEATSLAASYTGNVLGTSGQISVVGGTGINSNATVSLVATGVTAGTYGNATYSPIITVDTYGRIQNVDLVQNIGGGGNGNVDLSTVTTEAFKSIAVAGQTTVSADTKDDTLTFVAGTGMQITTNAGTDTITFTSTVSGGANSINDLTDVDTAGIADGQVLAWVAANSQFEAATVSGGGGGGNIDLTSFSVTTQSASSGGSLSYNSLSGVFTFRPADLSNYVTGNVGVSAGTYGSGTNVPQITVNEDGQVTSVTEVPITVSGGGGDTTVERFKLNYASNGDLNSASNLTSGISTVSIDSVSGGEVTITFNNANYNLPPVGILMYGYDYVNNVYVVSPMETTMTLRSVAAGGTSGSPTLFDGTGTVELRLRLREAETGASRSFGTTTHAWIQFSMAG